VTPALPRAVHQYVGHRFALLAARPEAGYRAIPDFFAGAERPHFSKSDPLTIHAALPWYLRALPSGMTQS
jgi:hypothetical protein